MHLEAGADLQENPSGSPAISIDEQVPSMPNAKVQLLCGSTAKMGAEMQKCI